MLFLLDGGWGKCWFAVNLAQLKNRQNKTTK